MFGGGGRVGILSPLFAMIGLMIALYSAVNALYLAVIQAPMHISMKQKMRRAPNTTEFQKFEISWSAAEREFDITYRSE